MGALATNLAVVVLLTGLLEASATCSSTIPTTGTNAIELSFFSNPSGGTEGADCPVACTSSIKQQWYAIAGAVDTCYQWPGHSGENAMKNGRCDTSTSSYTYDQWTNCECSGAIGSSKHVYTTKCVVDKPATLCSKITNYDACTASAATTAAPSTASSTTTAAPSPTPAPTSSTTPPPTSSTTTAAPAPTPAPTPAPVSSSTAASGNSEASTKPAATAKPGATSAPAGSTTESSSSTSGGSTSGGSTSGGGTSGGGTSGGGTSGGSTSGSTSGGTSGGSTTGGSTSGGSTSGGSTTGGGTTGGGTGTVAPAGTSAAPASGGTPAPNNDPYLSQGAVTRCAPGVLTAVLSMIFVALV